MSKRQGPDTEPDDAFSLILGDVNHSPLLRHGAAMARPAPQPEKHGAEASPEPERPSPFSFPAPVEPSPPAVETSARQTPVEDASPAASHPWLSVQIDTCSIRPSFVFDSALDDTRLEEIRAALIAAMEEDVAVIRLDVQQGVLPPRALAMVMGFARLLSEKGDKRLVLSNCAPVFKSFLDSVRLRENNNIASS